MTRLSAVTDVDRLDFSKGNGLVTVVAQDARNGAVLMVAHADREAIERTLATGEMHYRSRTRGLWHKGETSGNIQRVERLDYDCDHDAILARVVPAGPACHTGTMTCFGGEGTLAAGDVLTGVARVIRERATATDDDASSYTRKLLGNRNLRLKKLGEEAAELVLACADGDRARATEEAADLLYHSLVALQALDVGLEDVARVLAGRMR